MNDLFRKFLEFGVGNIAVLIIGFLSTPIVTRLVGPVEYGKANMFITITSLIVLVLTLGMDQAFVRYYNEEDDVSKGKFLLRSIKLPVITNILLGIIMLVLYKFISMKIVGEVSLILTLLLLVHSTMTIISNFALLNIRMKQKGTIYSLLSITNKIVFLIAVIINNNFFKDNYMTIVLATVIGNCVMAILAIFFARDDWFVLKEKSASGIKTETKEMIAYGIPFIFSMGLTWIFQSIDRVFIVMLGGYSDEAFLQAGLYAGAMTIVGLLTTFQWAFATFWVPVAYEKYSKSPEDKSFFNNINQIVSVVMLLLSIGLITFKDLIVYLLGSEYNGVQFIFPFLVLMPIMYTISETTVLGINFKKKTKYHIYVSLFAAITNICGNIILVPILGARGAAISTGLAYVVFFVFRTYFGNKLYNFGFEWKKLFLSVSIVVIFATYSSLYNLNIVSMALSIICILLIGFIYRKIIKNSIVLVINKIRNNKVRG